MDVPNFSIPIILQSQVLYSTEEVKEKKESLQTIIDFSLNINYVCDYKEAECISTDSNKGYYCKTINDELYTIFIGITIGKSVKNKISIVSEQRLFKKVKKRL